MADGTRKASRARQPVTRHPLFPVIVALWFCALFALGSLAIRVTLLENAVVASGIDLIVPAAAPPLGITARILLALMLGLIGALIGFALGTRIGRARPEAPQRRRTNLSTQEPPLPRRADRFIPADSPPPRPLSAFDELGDHAGRIDVAEPEPVGPHLGLGRRRALALAEPTGPDYARNNAPLPGGEDVPMAACFDNDDGDVLDLAEALPEETLVSEHVVPEYDGTVPVSPAVAEQEDPEPLEYAYTRDAPEVEAGPTWVPRLFEQGGPARRFAQPGTSASAAPSAHDDEMPIPRLIGADPVAPAAELEEDDRGLPPRNLGRHFGAPAVASDPIMEPAATIKLSAPAAPRPEPDKGSLFAIPAASGSAAEHLRSTPLDNLSQLELIERLALSMQQRRAAAEAAAAAAARVEPESPAIADRQAEELPRFGFEPRTPLALDEPPPTFAPAPEFMPLAAPFARAIPAALRPIGFDPEPAEDEGADDLVPRFAFARPVSEVPAMPEQPPVPTAYQLAVDLAGEREDADELEEAVVEGENFSSLLDLNRIPQRQPLIRIDEPMDEDAPIEPVVVFPGQGSRPFAAPAPAAVAASATAAPALERPAPSQPGLRRFDSPAAEPAAAAHTAAPRQDPEETERALRAALATLQRMSGAA